MKENKTKNDNNGFILRACELKIGETELWRRHFYFLLFAQSISNIKPFNQLKILQSYHLYKNTLKCFVDTDINERVNMLWFNNKFYTYNLNDLQ